MFVQPCGNIPKLSFSFDNGRKWAVRPIDMNLGRVSSHSRLCVGAVAGVDIGLGDSTWILGCSFLKVRAPPPPFSQVDAVALSTGLLDVS